jgi:hypothetical protein
MPSTVTAHVELLEALRLAAVEAARLAPGVRIRASGSAHGAVDVDAEAAVSLASAALAVALVFRPNAITVALDASDDAREVVLRLDLERVAQEVPVNHVEWRRIERSIAEVEGRGGRFRCRWMPVERRYALVFTVPLRALAPEARALRFE